MKEIKNIKIPLCTVNRTQFLMGQFPEYYQKYANSSSVPAPRVAGVAQTEIEQAVSAIIKKHTALAALISGGMGAPGALSQILLVPADMVQVYVQLWMVAQKLAYLYGVDNLNNPKEETQYAFLKSVLWVFFGEQAGRFSNKVLARHFGNVAQKLLVGEVSSQMLYKFLQQAAGVLGIKIATKKAAARFLSKALPFVSAFVSAGITGFTFYPACKHFHTHLRENAKEF